MTQIRTPVAGLYTDNLTEVNSASALELINCIPQDDEVAVSPTQPIRLQIVNTANNTIDATVKVYVEDPVGAWTVAYDETAGGFQTGFTGTATRTSSPGTAVLDELWITLSRTVPWGSLHVIGVRVTASSGAATLDATYNFVVADTEAPTITECLWYTPRRCRIRFSEAMNTSEAAGGTLFHRYIAGGVEVRGANELFIPITLDASYEGAYLDQQGSIFPRNCKPRLVSSVDLDAALVFTGKVLLDTSPGTMEADTGVDYNAAGKISRRRTMRATIGSYVLQARTDLEGLSETTYDEEKIQAAFAPLIKSVSLPEAGDVPSGDVVSQYVVIDFEDDVSLGRWYTLRVYNVEDDDGNAAASLTLDLQTPMFGCPVNRQQLWSFFPGSLQEKDLLAEQQLRKMSVVLQDLLNVMWLRADGLDTLLDAWQCPEQLIDHLLYTLGNPFRFPIPSIKQKRRLAEALPELYQGVGIVRRGATDGAKSIEGMIKFFLGIDAVITPYWPSDTWRLGVCLLGASAIEHPGLATVLGPSSSFLRNSYDVDVRPLILTDEQQRIVREICTWADPCTMHLARILMATPAPVPGAEWVLGSAGYSEVGLTTVLT